MAVQRVWFQEEQGGKLAGELHVPEGVARPPVVVFAHGRGSSKASPRNRAIADALRSAGIAALLFDFRGHGESEGELEELALEDQEADLRAALGWVESNPALGPIGIAGSSSGAVAAIAVAARDARVKALVLRAPSADARRALAARIEAPTLVVLGDQDPLFERGCALVRALHCEQRLCTVPGAGHLFAEPGSFEVAVRETVSWFQRQLLGARENAGGVRPRPVPRPALADSGPFRDRCEAGRLLARQLEPRRAEHPLVLALPRGGIDVAEPIASALDADLDVFVARKIRAPDQPELAIGAVAEGGVVLWNEPIVRSLGLRPEERARQLDLALGELEERAAWYRAVAPRTPIAGRTVLLTDDGVATGATLKAALQGIRAERPARIVVALPGGPSDTLDEIAATPGVDELIVLVVPEPFWAVGQLYESFAQVSSERVCEVLRQRRRRGARRQSA
jgi:predicted phosphoribosyltransferase/alpha-beta hydrolase superfamily lysophospholipase